MDELFLKPGYLLDYNKKEDMSRIEKIE